MQEEGKQPETTVTVKEELIPEEEVSFFKPVTPEEPALIEELPEEVTVTEVVTKEGKAKTTVHKKRVLKKKVGDKEETTEIVTVEEEGKSTDGKQTQKTTRKRVVRKKKGDTQETTEIVTVQEEGKQPETTVTVKEELIPEEEEEIVPEEKLKKLPKRKPKEAVVVEELPEEIQVTQVTSTDGKQTQKTTRKRVVRKKKGDTQETTEIVTVQEEGKQPETTVTVKEELIPEEEKSYTTVTVKEELIPEEEVSFFKPVTPEEPALIEELPEEVTELPEEIQVTQVTSTDGKQTQKTTRKRVVRKKKVKEELTQETTEIVTVQEEGKQPETTVTVKEELIPEEEVSFFKPVTPEEPALIEELPEEVTVTEVVTKEGKPKKTVHKKRILKKKVGDKEETTEIVTVEEEGKKPETTVTVKEEIVPEEKLVEEEGKKPETTVTVKEEIVPEEKLKKLPKRKPKEAVVVEELPEEIQVTQVTSTDGKQTQKTTRKEEGKKPETTVTVKEEIVPEEKLKKLPKRKPKEAVVVEELPEEIQVTQVTSTDGKQTQKTTRKRVVRKKKGPPMESKHKKQQENELFARRREELIPEEEVSFFKPVTPEEPALIEELPEEVTVTEVVTKEGKPKKTVHKKRILKKKVGDKKKGDTQETTEIVTVQEEGKQPETTVTVKEELIPEEEVSLFKPVTPEEPALIEELPEEVTEELIPEEEVSFFKPVTPEEPALIEELPEEVTGVVRKKKGDTQETTEIVTVQEEGKQPETTVTVKEELIPEEEVSFFKPVTPEEPALIEELPEEVTVTEVVTKEGKPKKTVHKKRVLKKKVGDKEETTEIVTVEEEGKKPETTVTVKEEIVPEEKLKKLPKRKPKEAVVVEELPEEIQVTQVTSTDGKQTQKTTRKRVVRKKKGDTQETTEIVTVQEEGKQPTTRKRVVRKKKGDTQETTEIVTVQEEGKQPETTVTVKEELIPEEEISFFKPVKSEETALIEELPEEVTVTEIVTKEGKPKKTVHKKRVLKKKIGDKEETTEIVTIEEEEEEGKSPKSFVTVTEEESTKDTLKPLAVVEAQGHKIEELPESVEEMQVIDESGVPKKRVVKKRLIRERKGDSQEITRITTVFEEGVQPQTFIEVEEMLADVEEQPVNAQEIVELPEEQHVIEIDTKAEEPRKKITKKRKLLKKVGPNIETTEITTVIEDGKEPERTVTVTVEREGVGPNIETTEITTVIEDGKEPERTLRGQKTMKMLLEENILFVPTLAKRTEDDEDVVINKARIEMLKKATSLPQYLGTEEEEVDELQPHKYTPKHATCEEYPELIKVEEIVTPTGLRKRSTKQRRIKKKEGDKEVILNIVSVEEEGEEPKVTMFESSPEELDIQDAKPVIILEELPEETELIESIDDKGKLIKKTIKRKKLKKKDGDKEEITDIITVSDENQEPKTEVIVTVKPKRVRKEQKKPKEELPRDSSEPARKQKGIKPIKIEKIEAKPKPVEIVKIDDLPKLLKKKSSATKKPKKSKVPKIRLKSRITPITFPPVNEAFKTPVITDLPPIYKDSGILSRNIKEAEKELKTRRRKLEKLDKDLKDLEKLDLEFTDIKKETPEKLEEMPKYVRKPKTKEEKLSAAEPLKLGKGKLPKDEDVTEEITLKKTPSKKPKEETKVADDQKPSEQTSVKARTPKHQDTDKLEPYKPYDIEREMPELEDYKKSPEEDLPGKEVDADKDTYQRKKKKPHSQDTETTAILKGTPKEDVPAETPDIKLKYKQGPKPDDIPEKIVLKPFTKASQSEEHQEGPLDIGKPRPFDRTDQREDIDKPTFDTAEKPKRKRPKKLINEKDSSEQPSTETEEVETLRYIEEPAGVIETLSEKQEPITKTEKRRVIKKRAGRKQEITEIKTVEEGGKAPITTVTVREEDIPMEEIDELPIETPEKTEIIEELPEEIKTETTEVVTVEEEGKQPERTVTVKTSKEEKIPAEEDTVKPVKPSERKPKKAKAMIEELPEEVKIKPVKPSERKPKKAKAMIEELPEEVKITEVMSEQHVPVNKVEKKRVIKKRDGQTTEVVTVEEEGKQPVRTVTVKTSQEEKIQAEEDTVKPVKPSERKPKKAKPTIEELPEEIKITEVLSEEHVPVNKVEKKRVIKKREGRKQEITEIKTVEEGDKAPVTTVTDGKVETTEVVTVEEEGKQPERTVTVKTSQEEKIQAEEDTVKPVKPSERKPKTAKPTIEELPEEIKITEVLSEEHVPVNKVEKKRVIKKREGRKQEITEIKTVEEGDKAPVTTVTVTEEEIPLEEIDELPIETPEKPEIIEELPEEIKVIETVTPDKTTTKIVKRKVYKKPKKDGKVETTEVVTVEEEEEIKVIETVTPDKTTTKIVKRKVYKKPKKDGKVETTEVVTVEEEGKQPERTVTVKTSKDEKIPTEEDTVKPVKPSERKPKKAKPTIEELPEEVKIIEVLSEEHVPHPRKQSRRLKNDTVKPVKPSERKPKKAKPTIEELPEEIKITEVLSEEHVPVNKVEKKRVIKKHETDEIDKLPIETPEKPEIIEELPEEIKVIETVTPDKTTTKIVKRKVYKKPKKDVEEEGKQPERTVTVKTSKPMDEEEKDQVSPIEDTAIIEEIHGQSL
ncbi:hypothetical protein QE152_g15166 [Popillia japonica]|uniref:Titin n=1 Tax=Popillia japonica TaxID=7064 RepID=A0AAW1L9X6_POPJA